MHPDLLELDGPIYLSIDCEGILFYVHGTVSLIRYNLAPDEAVQNSSVGTATPLKSSSPSGFIGSRPLIDMYS